MPNLGGTYHSSAHHHQDNPGVWYEEDTVIPYLTRYRAMHSKALDSADLARWMKAPVVR